MILLFFFFFNDTATTEIYTLSLHDALPIFNRAPRPMLLKVPGIGPRSADRILAARRETRFHDLSQLRSEEHTSELQSRQYLVCRLLLEKKKIINNNFYTARFLLHFIYSHFH